MNEDEWLTGTDFNAHVRFAVERLSPRRQRLLATGFCRAVGALTRYPDLLDALNVVELFADGLVPVAEIARVRQLCRVVAQQAHEAYTRTEGAGDVLAPYILNELAWAVANAASTPLSAEGVGHRSALAAGQARSGILAMGSTGSPELSAAIAEEYLELRGVVWEVVGNPFRPAHFSPDWRTDTVVSLARPMYAARDFSAMPILADALQDAGCDDEELLAHCRSDAPHLRGCWALDLVLGLE